MKSLFLAAVIVCSLFKSVLAVSGDTQCQNAMCVTAIHHNNQTTSYDLTVTQPQVGWMSIGFGISMIGAPMIIVWRDGATGETIVSHRAASDLVMPIVVSSPNPVATPLGYRAVSNSSATTLSFSVPSTSQTSQDLIWAWSGMPPSGNSVDAIIAQHDDYGRLLMNLANPLPDSVDGPTSALPAGVTPTPTPTPVASYGQTDISLTSGHKAFIAHGVFLALAFLVVLPIGALQARFLRTFVPGKWWFAAHWILQWPVALVLGIIGYVLGWYGSNKLHVDDGDSTHKKWGVVLGCLWVAQCVIGGAIHFIKSSKSTGRPIQNYVHAIIGILIIALSFWQVYTGLDDEWPRIGGPKVPTAFWTWWKVWIVLMPLLYVCGLVLIPRQYRLERRQREKEQPIPMEASAPRLQTRFGLRDA